jgi:prophage tail gpP-like protein
VNTLVAVVDDEYGLRGHLWVESVEFKRNGSGTTTTLTLLRPADLVYGEPANVNQ